MLNPPRSCMLRRVPRATVWLAASCLLAVAAAHQASAQKVVFEGSVVDDVTESPLTGVRVILLNRYDRVAGYDVTDDAGRFRFERDDYGIYRLDVKAVGYEPALTSLMWMVEGRDYVELQVRLAPNAVLLAPLEIVAASPLGTSPVLENMLHRRMSGFGFQITRDDIERRRPAQITDMLVELPGVYAARRGSGASGRALYIGRSVSGVSGRDCPVQVFLDGMLATRGVPGGDVLIDDLVHPEDVEAIEVFRGLATVPPEFLNPDARCGVIAIWTRRSTDSRP